MPHQPVVRFSARQDEPTPGECAVEFRVNEQPRPVLETFPRRRDFHDPGPLAAHEARDQPEILALVVIAQKLKAPTQGCGTGLGPTDAEDLAPWLGSWRGVRHAITVPGECS